MGRSDPIYLGVVVNQESSKVIRFEPVVQVNLIKIGGHQFLSQSKNRRIGPNAEGESDDQDRGSSATSQTYAARTQRPEVAFWEGSNCGRRAILLSSDPFHQRPSVRTSALLDHEHRCRPGLYSTGFYEPPRAIFQLCSPEITETIHKRAWETSFEMSSKRTYGPE
jgi:hypothetical protein